MLATITQLFGRPATYTTSDSTPNVTGTLHTYGQISDDEVRAYVAQHNGGQAHDYQITRPDAA